MDFINRKRHSLTANDHDNWHPLRDPQPVKKRKRIVWLDIAKGIGMFAVVCGHNLKSYVEQNPDSRYLYNFVYWWHMPLFFLISGFFLKAH
ncbi:acyltransferase family protein [Secundilactobacillus silagei]|uniref:acyltransferase family protein n=1 Tax=Secundilactobacillus silagei TaxID=1293415 RepID=UPI0006D0B095